MRFRGERDRAVRDPVREFCERVARTRRDNEQIEQFFRTDRLDLGNSVQDRFSADVFDPLNEFFRLAETRVGRICVFGHDRSQIIADFGEPFELICHFFKRAEGAAERKSYPRAGVVSVFHFFSPWFVKYVFDRLIYRFPRAQRRKTSG